MGYMFEGPGICTFAKKARMEGTQALGIDVHRFYLRVLANFRPAMRGKLECMLASLNEPLGHLQSLCWGGTSISHNAGSIFGSATECVGKSLPTGVAGFQSHHNLSCQNSGSTAISRTK